MRGIIGDRVTNLRNDIADKKSQATKDLRLNMFKKFIIAAIIIISLYISYSLMMFAFSGAPSPLWSDTDCGGIDPYFDIDSDCYHVGRGYKQQCRFFICTKEKVPMVFPE
jgi:hypothetical protein